MLNNIIFVDTGAIYALASKKDKHHLKATEYLQNLPSSQKLVISNFVFVESWSLLNSHLGWQAALAFYDDVLAKVFHLIDVQQIQIVTAREIIDKYSDHCLSLVDVTSFVLMEQFGINSAFSFDYHFRIYRKKDGSCFQVFP